MTIKVCLGGTFNEIHQGHIALLSRGFQEGDELHVGLTSDSMARSSREVPVKDYEARLSNLRQVLEKISQGKSFWIFPIEDGFGPAIIGDFDKIVVSEETLAGAERINDARESRSLKKLTIIVVSMVLASDGKPISSTRIIKNI